MLPPGDLLVMDVSQRSRKGVVETAPTGLLPPPAVPPQHRVGHLRRVLPTPGLLYSVDHAGVEIRQRTAAAPESHVQLLIHVFGLEPQQRRVLAAFIEQAQVELTGVPSGNQPCTGEGETERERSPDNQKKRVAESFLVLTIVIL